MNKMNLKYSLVLMVALFLQLCQVTHLSAQEIQYPDYNNLTDSMEYRIKDFFRKHKEIDIRNLQTGLLNDLSVENKVHIKSLPAPRKKVLSGRKLYQLCKESTLVVCQQSKAGCRFFASAVALTADGICASNYHVFAELVLSGTLNGTFQNDYLYFVMLADGRAFPLKRILAIDPINDFAIFQIETGKEKLTPMPLGKEAMEGDDIYCLSHPQGILFYLTKGVVSRNHSRINRATGQRREEMQISANYAVGSSGGPIIDTYGNLIGIVSSTHSLYADQKNARNFQMSIKNTVPGELIRNCFILNK